MRPLISHEIPKQLFNQHDRINDYPYLLAHLLLKKQLYYDQEYSSFYKECVKKFEYSLMDNSCYELGSPVENQELVDLSLEYQISHIIIPDVYRDWFETIRLAEKCIPALSKSGKKLFGVLQGVTGQEMLDCYDFFNSADEVDVIGINFQLVDNKSRVDFFRYLRERRVVTKKIHFLGVATPYEYLSYTKEEISSIYSVDTSNPIICGWSNYRYKAIDDDSKYVKPIEKLAENLDRVLNEKEISTINYNVASFKTFVTR